MKSSLGELVDVPLEGEVDEPILEQDLGGPAHASNA